MGKPFGLPVQGTLRTYAERSVNDGRFRLIRPFGDTSVGIKIGSTTVYPPHTGQDYGNFRCGGPVIAQGDGVITHAGWGGDVNVSYPHGMGGLMIYNDLGGGYEQRAAHMSKLAVAVGQQVKKGQVVGYVGDTGAAPACHLHSELLLNGKFIDPQPFIEKGELPTEDVEMFQSRGGAQHLHNVSAKLLGGTNLRAFIPVGTLDKLTNDGVVFMQPKDAACYPFMYDDVESGRWYAVMLWWDKVSNYVAFWAHESRFARYSAGKVILTPLETASQAELDAARQEGAKLVAEAAAREAASL